MYHPSTYFQWFAFKGDFKARSLIIITKRTDPSQIRPKYKYCLHTAYVIDVSRTK